MPNMFVVILNLRKTLALIRSLDPSFPEAGIADDEVDIIYDFFGKQYAHFHERGMAPVNLAARCEGIVLDGTHTGKALAALVDRVKNHGIGNKAILFWNTYNARDFSDVVMGVDYHQLPGRFHRYFEEDVQPLDKNHS